MTDNANEATLLKEGARSYLEACTALFHYQQEVQRRCRRVMEGYLEGYSSALGMSLHRDDIEAMAWPESKEWDGSGASLGVRIVKRDIVPGVRWWETYCSLEWEYEPSGFFCYIGEWFHRRKLANTVFERFRQGKVKLTEDDRNIGIYAPLTPEQALSFEEALEGVSLQWIKLWKTAGGMRKMFKDCRE